MKSTSNGAYRTTYHRDHTVTVWDVYTQGWVRTSRPSDRILASMSGGERERVKKHLGCTPQGPEQKGGKT